MNTLLVTVDALRADHLGQYGYHRDTMPVLDEIQDAGAKFTEAHSNAPYTRISVPAIQTSRHLGYATLDEVPTVASILNEAGVTTTLVGTQVGMNLVDGDFGYGEELELGRDEYHDRANRDRPVTDRLVATVDGMTASVGRLLRRSDVVYENARAIYDAVVPDPGFRYLGYTSAEVVTDRVVDWLDASDADEFFLWVHYMEGHRPYGVHDENPRYVDGAVDEATIRELMRTAGTAPGDVTEEQHRLMVDLYDSDLRYCSRHVHRLFDWMRNRGLWDETNVVFTSDHGEEFGEHGRYFHRNYPYDELIHVPLLVKSEHGSGEVITEQRELLDVAPTVCEFHGIGSDVASFRGTPLFEGDRREVVVLGSGTADESEKTVAGRWDGWKYIRSEETERLYDLDADPSERHDVVDDRRDVARRFRRAIPDRLFEREPEMLSVPDDERARERLKALGYLERSPPEQRTDADE